jgi:hypothetical protein
MAVKKKTNYLTNKEIIKEIHRSKNSYSYYIDDKYKNYDYIVADINEINKELLEQVRIDKALGIERALRSEQREAGVKNHQIKVDPIDPATIRDEDIVWRVMTFDHIPLAPGRVKTPKRESDNHVKLLFPPYKHYILENGEMREVGRSHWRYALENGEFSQEHGRITNNLAKMFMLLVERYSQKGNWRSYTYLEEMRAQAILQLSTFGLSFNELRSDNPFSYYTRVAQNSFTRVLLLEKKNQAIRDDLLTMSGATPSITRQIENSLAQRALANGELPEAKKLKNKRPPVKPNPVNVLNSKALKED